MRLVPPRAPVEVMHQVPPVVGAPRRACARDSRHAPALRGPRRSRACDDADDHDGDERGDGAEGDDGVQGD